MSVPAFDLLQKDRSGSTQVVALEAGFHFAQCVSVVVLHTAFVPAMAECCSVVWMHMVCLSIRQVQAEKW